MKVLFLDVDGALNNVHTQFSLPPFKEEEITKEHIGWEKFRVQNLAEIIHLTGCEIVISSTWRVFTPFEYWRRIFELYNLPDKVISKTPQTLTGPRGYEIDLWLQDNPVENYAIVDDDSDMYPHQLPHFVKVDFEKGLTWSKSLELIKILGEKE